MASPYTDPTRFVSTRYHRAWLASGCISVLISLAKAVTGASRSSPRTWLQLIASGLVGYVMADLATGIYHWAIDNYGCSKTPIFGPQIESFLVHHRIPWAIATRPVAYNLHVLAQGVTFMVLPITLLYNDPVLLGFMGVFGGCIIFCQQFHAWAHGAKPKLPQLVVALQNAGIIVPRLQHAAHHRPPYNSNYCIVSGMWNRFLDKSKFFVALEIILFYMLGVQPRSWTEPNSESTQGTEFQDY
ncbi:unnamed protein product [Fraxinus pennsylvanica]|uniref:Lipid desaturase domain-containing protein n=1 Tax=Fraxinus pennsylvanica TaxID=56036 RepID=A0AAD1Z2J6_9LAMI|nr:unnamed protein product [Fraxinus pennsylvanica]